MIDRGKVIRGLKCMTNEDPQMALAACHAAKCPYIGVDCEMAVMRDALEVLNQIPTVGNWISVKDGLPERHDKNDHEADVMLYIPKREGVRQHGIYLGFLRETPLPPDDGSGNFWNRPCPGSDWTVWGWSHFEEPKVTHWMELPNEPKEGDTECD